MKQTDRTGQAIVEFAMVLVLLLILLIGMAELSLVLYNQAVITNAAREGARVGIVAPNLSKIDGMGVKEFGVAFVEPTVRKYCQGNLLGFPAGTATITLAKNAGDDPSKATLTVTVAYKYNWLVLPGFITLAKALQLSATAQMRFE